MPFVLKPGTKQLMVAFCRQNMAMVSTEGILKMAVRLRPLYCIINPYPAPIEDGFLFFC